MNSKFKQHIDLDIIEDLKNTIEPKTYTVYRGFHWSNLLEFERLGISLKTLLPHQKVTLKLDHLSSWTTHLPVAYHYSERNFTDDKIRLVFKVTVPFTNVLADLTDYGEENPKIEEQRSDETDYEYMDRISELYSNGRHSYLNQKEVILQPGSYDVEVLHIQMNLQGGKGGERRSIYYTHTS